jgi:dUTP pyrophosphatase
MPSEIDIDNILQEEKDLFMRKLHDYGTEDMAEAQIPGVVARLNEKLLRVKNLLKQSEGMGGRAMEEPIRDTFLDLMGYSLIAILLHDGIWEVSEGISVAPEPTPTLNKFLQVQRSEEAKKHPLPFPKKAEDVGYDMYTVRDFTIPHSMEHPVDVPTEIKVKLPSGHWALVINRSSTARKLGIDVVNGVIDTGYVGELFACCWNRTGQDIKVEKGTRLAQFVVLPSITPDIIEVDKLPETERGETGFGSTN